MATAVIIPVIVSLFLFQLQYSITTQYQQKEAANKFLSEIEILEPFINAQNSYYVNSREMATKDPSTPMMLTVDSIYPSSGLYYINANDLGKFDHNLTKNLTKFYFDLTTAESTRKQVIAQSIVLSPNSTASEQERNIANQTILDGYKTIIMATDSAAIQIPNLKSELLTVSNKKPFVFW